MTKREENLKKINDELELMSDEKLEGVAGGSNLESSDDSKFLNTLLKGTSYHQCKQYSEKDLKDDLEARLDVLLSWSSIGVEIKLLDNEKNIYILNGKEITRAEALAHAENLVGKHLTK